MTAPPDADWVRISLDRIIVAASDLLAARESCVGARIAPAELPGDAEDRAATDAALEELLVAAQQPELEVAAARHAVAWARSAAGMASRCLLTGVTEEVRHGGLEQLADVGKLLRDLAPDSAAVVPPLVWSTSRLVAWAGAHAVDGPEWGLSSALTESSPTGELCWRLDVPGLLVQRPRRWELRSFPSGTVFGLYTAIGSDDPRFDVALTPLELPVPRGLCLRYEDLTDRYARIAEDDGAVAPELSPVREALWRAHAAVVREMGTALGPAYALSDHAGVGG